MGASLLACTRSATTTLLLGVLLLLRQISLGKMGASLLARTRSREQLAHKVGKDRHSTTAGSCANSAAANSAPRHSAASVSNS